MSLPETIIAVLSSFQPAFTQPTWKKAQTLLVGTLLGRGRRTVAAALRHMGLQDDANFSKYHHLLNRATWSGLEVSRRLLQLLVKTFIPTDGTVAIVVDETLERRWGRKIHKRGHYRDSRLSSRGHSVSNSGLRWIVMALVVTPQWTKQPWALPFLSVLSTTPQVSAQLGQRHQTVPQRTMQMIALVRRWLPQARIKLVGDSTYSGISLGLVCRKHQVTQIAPLRLDASLHAPRPLAPPGKPGRPRIVGPRLPKLRQVAEDPQTQWHKVSVAWYSQGQQELEVCSGSAWWYLRGYTPLPIRWVLARDPAGKRPLRAFYSTDPDQLPASIVSDFVQRWPLEVTFEESRAHLGIETQRQWSDAAIERSTPSLFGLYSLVALLGQALHAQGQLSIYRTAWYAKTQATFADVLAAIRRQLWGGFDYGMSPGDPNLLLIPRSDLRRLAQAVCYSV